MAYSAWCDTATATRWWITGTGSTVNRLSEVMDDNPAGVEEDDNPGNFQPWTTFMTEHIEDFDYQIHLSFDVGDWSTPTILESKDGEHVYGDDGALFKNLANAILQLGSKANNQSGLGASWNFQIEDGFGSTFCVSGSIFKAYGSLITFRGLTKDAAIYETEIKQSIFANLTGGRIVFHSATTDISGQVYFYKNYPRFFKTPVNAEDIHGHNGYYGVMASWTGETITLKGLKLTNANTDINAGGSSGSNVNVDSPVNNIGTVQIDTVEDVWIRERYLFNLHIRDKDGANLGTVTCLLEDTDGNEIFNVSTAGDGTITEQTVPYKKWLGTSETLTEYTPHKLTLTKAGYEPTIIPNITMDEDKDLEYRLLPALAVGDVRSETDFGESKTGTLDLPADTDVRDAVDYDNAGETGVLDLPATGDVEKDVIFDNTTKTGTFEAPAESDVRLATDYGNSAEFIGSLDLPAVTDVEKGVQFDSTTKTGTFKKPATTDVRKDSQYGADDIEFTGELDLPAVGDVEKGVKFDSTTKTGTFREPGIANVREDIQYGEDDTEFTGTYVRNVIKIATQLNYDQYSITVATSPDPNIQVTVEDYYI